MDVVPQSNLAEHKIFYFPISDGLLFLNALDIISIDSDENYSFVEHEKGREFVLLSLKKVEAFLEAKFYFRCHRSYIVNLEKIKSFDKVMNQLLMSNGQIIPVSRIRKNDLLKRLVEIYNF